MVTAEMVGAVKRMSAKHRTNAYGILLLFAASKRSAWSGCVPVIDYRPTYGKNEWKPFCVHGKRGAYVEPEGYDFDSMVGFDMREAPME